MKPAADNMFSFCLVDVQPEARTRKAAEMLNMDVIFFIIILFVRFQFNSCNIGGQVQLNGKKP